MHRVVWLILTDVSENLIVSIIKVVRVNVGNKLLWNVGQYISHYSVQYPRTKSSSALPNIWRNITCANTRSSFTGMWHKSVPRNILYNLNYVKKHFVLYIHDAPSLGYLYNHKFVGRNKCCFPLSYSEYRKFKE